MFSKQEWQQPADRSEKLKMMILSHNQTTAQIHVRHSALQSLE